MKILLAVDGSRFSLDAVNLVIEHADWYREAPTVELVTVHLPVPRLPRMGMAVGKGQIQKYYEEEGEERLLAARKKLDAGRIKYRASVLVGDVAESIVKHARSTRCDLVCIGARGDSNLHKALVGSVATKILQISELPVLLVK